MKRGKYFGKLCFIALAFSPALAFADNCENARNGFDDIYCVNKVYASADNDLNKNYQALRKHLTSTQKSILKSAQINWIYERDEQCMTSDSSVDVQCRLEKTQERNHWLIERIRECKTVGCKTNELRN